MLMIVSMIGTSSGSNGGGGPKGAALGVVVMLSPRCSRRIHVCRQRSWTTDLGGRNGAAVDDVLGADDGRGAVGNKEPDQVGDLLGAGEPAERDTAQRVENSLFR